MGDGDIHVVERRVNGRWASRAENGASETGMW